MTEVFAVKTVSIDCYKKESKLHVKLKIINNIHYFKNLYNFKAY